MPLVPKLGWDVRFGSLADVGQPIRDVRFAPESGHTHRQHKCPLSAKSGHLTKLNRSFCQLQSSAPGLGQ
jgi:hypothetical protein